MSFMKELMNGVVKKFEVFEKFFHNKDSNLDYKTRLDEDEIGDMSYLHTLHEYMLHNWIIGEKEVINKKGEKKMVPVYYESPLYGYLQRKKALRVSLDGGGRKEMENILKPEINEDESKKGNWDRMVQT